MRFLLIIRKNLFLISIKYLSVRYLKKVVHVQKILKFMRFLNIISYIRLGIFNDYIQKKIL